MGRFYSITLSSAGTGNVLRQWSSQTQTASGPVDNGGALNVQFDFFEYMYAVPQGNCTLTIDGPDLQDLREALNLQNATIEMSAGMSAGLPLANPAQQGVILRGSVFQPFANWIGTDMTLDLVIVPSTFTQQNPGNFTFTWKKGVDLLTALKTTLGVVYPKASVVAALGGTYVNNFDIVGMYSTLANLAKMVKSYTAPIFGPGVDIGLRNNGTTIILTDYGATPTSPIQISSLDLIGQPTWVQPGTFQFMTPMRADILVGTYVLMPSTVQALPGSLTTIAATSPAQLKSVLSFAGAFRVNSVRHVGNFRDASGTSWASIFQCPVAVPN